MPASVVRIQISGSGAFSEPNNGVDLYPLDLSPSIEAKLSAIPILGTNTDVVQPAGSSAMRERFSAVSIGTWDVAKTQKEQALDNLIWHSSSASWQGRPVSISLTLGGNAEDTFTACVLNYSISPRKGIKRVFDVDVEFVRT